MQGMRDLSPLGFIHRPFFGGENKFLQKLDVESLVKGLEEEMAGKDLDAIVRSVKREE